LPELGEHGQTDGERDKLRQLNAIAEAFQCFGKSQTTLLVLEDLHWADNATLELLLHILPYVVSSRLLIIATFRSDEPRKDNMLRSVLGKLERDRSVFRIDLELLTDSEMHELIHSALGELELPTGAAAAICARAEGNPLFAEELLKTVVTERANGASKPLPATLRETVSGRLAGFDERDRTILIQAAAIGQRFQAEFLARIADAPLPLVLTILKRAIDSQFIREVKEDVPVQYAFRHSLIREALYHELLTDEARALHRRIGSILESQNDADAHVAELAYHFWRAREKEKLAVYSERAGDAAVAVFAHQDAADAYEQALAGAVDSARRAALNRKFALALHQCGHGERAIRAFEAAQAYYEEAGDVENAARACLNVAAEYITLGDADQHLRLNQRALDLVGNDPNSPAFFLAHVQLLDHYTSFRWDPIKAQKHVQEAERAGGPHSVADRIDFLEFRSTLAIGLGQMEAARALTDEAIALATVDGHYRTAVRCLGAFSGFSAFAGEHQLASEGFTRTLEIINAKKITGLTRSWTLIYLAYAKLLRGDLQETRRLVEESLSVGIEMKSYLVHLAGVGIPVGLMLQDDDLVTRCARKHLIDFALRSGGVQLLGAMSAFAESFAGHNHMDKASSLLHRVADELEPIAGIPTWDVQLLFSAFGRFGDLGELPRMRQILKRSAESSNMRSNAPLLALFDAYAAARQGNQNAAIELATVAAGQFHDIGWLLREAQALEIAGREREALEIYQQTGDVRDAQRLEGKFAVSDQRRRRKNEPTPREREVLDLVVRGKSNRSIAEALVISERTVENHISSILSKLGASTRSELIARYKASDEAK
jgi:DNA-binding CsgD family transcriptional regulator/tetratricopeptide (TPR) repeat protein